MKDDILIGDTPKAVRRKRRLKDLNASGRLWKHCRLSDLGGVVTEDEMRDFFVFTLVRNPWDRMVSYYYWLQDQSFEHPAVGLAQSATFSAFLNHPSTREIHDAETLDTYLQSPSGVQCCDCFVRIEHLKADLEPVEAHLGFALAPLPHLNASDRPTDYRAAYSDADAALVAGFYDSDIKRFGYSF